MPLCHVYRFCLHRHVNIWASDQKHWHGALCGMECTSLQSACAVNTCDQVRQQLCLAFFNCYNVKIFAEVCRASCTVTGMRGPCHSAKENTQFPTFLALAVCLYGAQYVLSLSISLLPKKSTAFSLCQVFIIVQTLMLFTLCVWK